jgi:hypothetical protein
MAEATICICLLLVFWQVMNAELIDSWKVFQKACHELKEARAVHKIRIAKLRTELKRIKERGVQ